MPEKSLAGQVALITGAAKRIGRSIALRLAAEGADIIISYDSSKSEAEALVEELNSMGRRALAVQADVSHRADVQKLFTAVENEFGRLDILVNNAGTNIRKRPEEYTIAEWNTVLVTNLSSAFVLAQAAFPEMQRVGGGKIINIGSMLSIFGAAFAAAYGASKGGLVQLTKALATAWAKDNIQVNAVLPGWIDTALTRQAREQVPALYERVLARTPAGRWGVPDDLGGIAIFLASRASDFVTGTAIAVDGGFSSQG
jgi:2-deoxy-D-gluconate 3-dehydrogenase